MPAKNAYAALSADGPLLPFRIERRAPGPQEVALDILYCGVCHSDIHTARNEWGNTTFPVVPGHEIIGRITSIGTQVTRHQVGDIVGIGCFVGSCRTCENCIAGEEQFCEGGVAWTYNSKEKTDGKTTYGGYSTTIVADEQYVLRIPGNLPLAGTAPLLCAGITTYSPMRYRNVGTGTRVGILGLGGLGHMGVKIATAFGAQVTVISASPAKEEDARRLGAEGFLLSTDDVEMQRYKNHFDFILNTVSAPHDYNRYLQLLRLNGNMTLVGIPPKAIPLRANMLTGRRRSISGSLIGGIRETQEMLDFCGTHNIVSDVEVIGIDQVNEAFERILRSDVRYRFVIDMASFRNESGQ